MKYGTISSIVIFSRKIYRRYRVHMCMLSGVLRGFGFLPSGCIPLDDYFLLISRQDAAEEMEKKVSAMNLFTKRRKEKSVTSLLRDSRNCSEVTMLFPLESYQFSCNNYVLVSN